eukprot:scaffold3043_cov180-Amphora_coffeaeformis.AAC.15
MAPLLPTSRADIVASVANQQVEQLKQNAGITEPSIAEMRREKRRRRAWTVVVGAVAGITVATSLAIMAIEASFICYMAFIIPVIVAPYMVLQRRLINKLPTIVGQINLCREHVNRLAAQNVRFTKENDRFESELNRLELINGRLEEIVGKNGADVTEFQKLVKENGAIEKQKQDILKAQEIQQVMAAVFAADRNRDFHISEDELDRLIYNLRCHNVVDQARIKEALLRSSMGKSVTSLYRTLEEECLEDDPTMKTYSISKRNLTGIQDSANTETSFMYQCMA